MLFAWVALSIEEERGVGRPVVNQPVGSLRDRDFRLIAFVRDVNPAEPISD
jgi:hypothetical protein